MKQKRKALTGQQTRVTNKTRTPMNCTWEAFAPLHNGRGNTNGKHHTLLFCKLRSLKFQAQDKHNEHMHRHDLGQRQRAVQGEKRLVRWSEFGPQGPPPGLPAHSSSGTSTSWPHCRQRWRRHHRCPRASECAILVDPKPRVKKRVRGMICKENITFAFRAINLRGERLVCCEG